MNLRKKNTSIQNKSSKNWSKKSIKKQKIKTAPSRSHLRLFKMMKNSIKAIAKTTTTKWIFTKIRTKTLHMIPVLTLKKCTKRNTAVQFIVVQLSSRPKDTISHTCMISTTMTKMKISYPVSILLRLMETAMPLKSPKP